MTDLDRAKILEEVRLIKCRLESVELMLSADRSGLRSDDLDLPNDLISVSAAARQARGGEDTIRKRSRLQPYEAGGFGKKIGGRWWISQAPFRVFLRKEKQR